MNETIYFHVVLTDDGKVLVARGTWDARTVLGNTPKVHDVLGTYGEHERTEAEAHAYHAIKAIKAFTTIPTSTGGGTA